MIRHVFGLLVLAAAASAQKGISFSRTVQGGPPNANGASAHQPHPLLSACSADRYVYWLLRRRLPRHHPGLLLYGPVRKQQLQARVGLHCQHHGERECCCSAPACPRPCRISNSPPSLLVCRGCCCCPQYSLNEDLTAGSTLNLDLKVDKILPLKTTCPMCGGNCTINIAAIKQKVSFPMPDCPIAKGAGAPAAP